MIEQKEEYEEKLVENDPKNTKKGAFLKLTTYAAVFGLIGGLTFQGTNYLFGSDTGSEVVKNESQKVSNQADKAIVQTNTSTGTASSDGVSDVVEEVLPSIVSIYVKATVSQRDIFGRTYQSEGEGSGSGIIVGESNNELLMVTNNHVVAGADRVQVELVDGTTVDATVKGKDSIADLAVVAVELKDIKEETKSLIKVASLGDSEKVKVGEQAIAIGNALGYGISVTVGYVSATDREVTLEDGKMTLLQTDAAINPGNSGGALLNHKGEVIGINSVKYASSEVEGMGFAIPITTAMPIVNELMNREVVGEEEEAYLGIKGEDVTSAYAERYQMPEGIFLGVVTENSPAAKAGLLKGDIVTGLNGKSVKTLTALQEAMSYIKAGEKVELTIQRQDNGEYKEQKIEVTLGSKKEAEQNE